MYAITIDRYKDSEIGPKEGFIASLPIGLRKPFLNEKKRRRRGIINAVAMMYHVLIDPELLDALMGLQRDPLEVIGEAVGNMRPNEVVLNIGHFEVC